MAPIKWDAYRSLNITNRESTSMTCVGITVFQKRCRWNIPHDRVLQVHRILNDFETKAPEKATGSLKRLARLCLCEEYHQNQDFHVIVDWKDAIEEATKFYEKGQDLKERNRDLMTALTDEIAKRLVLEEKFEAETSQMQQDLKSVGAMSENVSLLTAKLTQAELESKLRGDYIQELIQAHYKNAADAAERISALQTARGEKSILAMRLELQKVKAREKSLNEQVSQLTRQLDNKLLENSTLQPELTQVKSERDCALSQKDEFKSQLELATEKIAQIGHTLQEAETARDMFSEEAQRLQARLNIEEQNLKVLGDTKAQLEQTNIELVQEGGTLSAQISSEHHSSAELRLSLQTTIDNLSRAETQQKMVNEELSRNKEDLGKLQAEFARAREDTDNEHRRFVSEQEVSLARIDDLMQEIAYAKNHLMKTLFVNLWEVTAGWAKSAIACFGRMRTRKVFDPVTMEENMSSP